MIGQLAPSAARAIDAQGAVLAGELSVDALRLLQSTPRYREIPRFPAVTRDLALVCPQELPYAEIARVLREAGEEFLAGFEPFDIFTDPTGARLPADRKSIAISLTFRAPGRTLNSEEVQTACERLQQKLKSELAVDLRE